MSGRKTIPIPLLSSLLIAASFVIGWSIPAFYDWTGSDQSRPSPVLLPIAIGLFVSVVLSCVSLGWLPIAYRNASPPSPVRFNIRSLLIATTVVAVLCVAYAWFALIGGVLLFAAIAYTLWFAIGFPPGRWPVAALLAVLYLPFLWVFPWSHTHGGTFEMAAMLCGLPGMLPTMFVGAATGNHPETLTGLMMILVGVELVVGTWLIRRGPKLAIGYTMALGLVSVYGSFILNALVRI